MTSTLTQLPGWLEMAKAIGLANRVRYGSVKGLRVKSYPSIALKAHWRCGNCGKEHPNLSDQMQCCFGIIFSGGRGCE